MTKTSYDKVLNTKEDLVFYDSETCGLHGMMVLLQFAVGEDGDIVLYEIWNEPVSKTLELIEAMMNHVVIGFNLTFDHFHLQKIHAIWSLLPSDWIPSEHIEEVAAKEDEARNCKCIKPFSALDLMLYSRRGPYQSLMARSDIRIRRVPLNPVQWKGNTVPMAYSLANQLEELIDIDPIYFSRKANPDAPKWNVYDRTVDGKVDRKFADVVLGFRPSGGLKALAEHALGAKPQHLFDDIELDKKLRPQELGFAPTASATSSKEENWEVWGKTSVGNTTLKGYAWPGVIKQHIDHWCDSEAAREYATDDVTYTRGLYYHFDQPAHGDNDSILSCMVPSVRWHGFDVDIEQVTALRDAAMELINEAPCNTNAPAQIRTYMDQFCDDTEMIHLADSTKKEKLQEMEKWVINEEEECLKCFGGLEPDCKRCDGTGVLKKGLHPAAKRAAAILGIKFAVKEVELYDKLLTAGKFHASFKITGTLSNRMAGGDGLNAQGIKNDKKVRRAFPLKWEGYELCGGDFDAFEVTIADAIYNDEDLRTSIVSGRKLAGIFGSLCYPGNSYEDILDSEKNPESYEYGNMYGSSKAAMFAMIYGGNANTLVRNQGIPQDVAEEAYKQWGVMFPGIERARKRVIDAHQPLVQAEGIGTAINWKDPKDSCESLLGFKRYHTQEYKIAHELFKLAQKLPVPWKNCVDSVVRSEQRGNQTASGAISSALYGTAFGLTEGVVRASANHEIQSTGAEITKALQVRIWEVQPQGVSEFIVAPMNVHDEVLSVTKPEKIDRVAEIVAETVESYRDLIPLVGMTWCKNMANWAEKSGTGGDDDVKITYRKEDFLKDTE